MGLFDKLFGKKEPEKEAPPAPPKPNIPPITSTEGLMTSQFAALYLRDNDPKYRDIYMRRLTQLGFGEDDAGKMFRFECDIVRRYGKQYLLHPQFTQFWFFSLVQPFFVQYPKTQEDILKEKFLTMSEICKILDEAEWHYCNSHERDQPDEVWSEICAWHLRWRGADYAIRYFEMIAEETGIPLEILGAYSNSQGAHLDKYKW